MEVDVILSSDGVSFKSVGTKCCWKLAVVEMELASPGESECGTNRLWLLLKKSIWHVPKAAYLTSKVTSSTWNCKIVYWRVRYKIRKGYSRLYLEIKNAIFQIISTELVIRL
jgi:hypothetical protein